MITVNGRVIKDSTETFFKETSSMKPKSFKNRVLLMKSYEVGYWYQSQQSMVKLVSRVDLERVHAWGKERSLYQRSAFRASRFGLLSKVRASGGKDIASR